MTSPEVRASRSRLVRDVTGELAKSKDTHACVLTHATQKCLHYPISTGFTHRREAIYLGLFCPEAEFLSFLFWLDHGCVSGEG